ncbi:MAG: hypothetical protein ACK5MQ_00375 [Pikeienuella sp.]
MRSVAPDIEGAERATGAAIALFRERAPAFTPPEGPPTAALAGEGGS